MQEAFILKLIILALAVTFIAVIIALVLSFNVTQKLMKHNANLVGQVKESDQQQASTRQALYETEHELHEAEAQLKIAHDRINDMLRQAKQTEYSGQSLQQEINDVANVADMTDEQLMNWIDTQMEKLGLYKNPDVTLKEIAQALGLTQRRVTQALKVRKEGNTLAEYLNTKRLLNGCRLLVEQPNWTIDAVAHEAGFGGTTTFRTIFRNRFGMSPKQYREKKRLIEGSQE
ncbi:MAG: helix-turn-helix domain-containing protein [Muribaculaceae bacterium]|nr:helix-turn-helix domain-containing protein [Muribaculaceae bacterium]